MFRGLHYGESTKNADDAHTPAGDTGFRFLWADGARTKMLLRTIGQRQFRTALDASHRQASLKRASAQSKNALLGRDLPLVITARADAFYGSGT